MPFGGIHILLCGDFFQIPPVASDPVYLDPSQAHKTRHLLDFIGYQKWRSAQDVVILKESMRQSKDPVYAGVMQRFRNGQATSLDMELINGRVVGPYLKDEMERSHKNREKVRFPRGARE